MVKANGTANNSEEGVCRDFLRNVCKRGGRCKFRHPEQAEIKQEMQFCHDYQNKMCTRGNCKFIHCSKEEEEYYHQTGDLPPGVEEAATKRRSAPSTSDGEVPICRDYQNGECGRASSCRYRHLSRGDLEHEERLHRRYARPYPPPPPDRYGKEYEHDRYRRWLEHSRYEDFDRMDRDRLYRERESREPREARDREVLPPGYSRFSQDPRDLEEENALLRRKNEELRKTVADLTSTNDVLLEQNARLRALRAEATSAVLQAETHLVNSTATAASLLSQGRSLGTSTHHTAAATAPVMYPARAAQVPIVAENAIPAPGPALREGAQLIAAPLQPGALAASMAQAQGHVVPMSVGVTASMVSYPIVSQTLRTAMS
ncbi:zinc finger CCCH domain-containing protein 10-like [Diadema antillarum]|uniref:zinc finger CCCH domain-containing protein 10-like n=1 Tax=Diadema antillarum TaxID=105358 RepID=UPI003A85B2B6